MHAIAKNMYKYSTKQMKKNERNKDYIGMSGMRTLIYNICTRTKEHVYTVYRCAINHFEFV